MSIFSEDILNYEIGDVDADDTDLTGADEDELLLSDDGKIINLLQTLHSHKISNSFEFFALILCILESFLERRINRIRQGY